MTEKLCKVCKEPVAGWRIRCSYCGKPQYDPTDKLVPARGAVRYRLMMAPGTIRTAEDRARRNTAELSE